MNLMRFTSIVVAASSILGCGTKPPGSNEPGWRTLTPPEENALGKYIEEISNNKNITLGGDGFEITDEIISISPSFSDVTSEAYTNYRAGAEASFKEITASAGIENTASQVSTSKGWSIAKIKNFSRGAPLEKEFVYKCIMLSEYSFETKNKTTGNVDVNASKLASTFGVAIAKVNVSSSPTSPDSLKVTIKNPNLCLSYVSAELYRPWFSHESEVRSITKKSENGVYENRFKLSLNETSDPRSPDLGKDAIDSKPHYRLLLSGTAEAPVLSFSKEDREFPDRPPTNFILKEKSNGKWTGQYGIENYYYGDMKYALVRLSLEAKKLPDGSVLVESATLYSPTYKLSLK